MYNRSEIMKEAWNSYRMAQKWVEKLSFGECLRRAWAKATKAVAGAHSLDQNAAVVCNGNRVIVRHQFVADVTMGWAVIGDTYRIRKEIKSAGFKWDPETRCWFTTDRAVATRFVKLYK